MAVVIFIRITNTAPTPEDLSAVNGASASFSCLARSIGPLITGPLFDWSNTEGIAGLPFWAMAVVAAMAAIEAWFLKDHN